MSPELTPGLPAFPALTSGGGGRRVTEFLVGGGGVKAGLGRVGCDGMLEDEVTGGGGGGVAKDEDEAECAREREEAEVDGGGGGDERLLEDAELARGDLRVIPGEGGAIIWAEEILGIAGEGGAGRLDDEDED